MMPTVRRRMPPLQRFAAHVDYAGPIPEKHPEAGPCHLWTASTFDSGYGQFGVGGGNVRAHRWVWLQIVGPIAEGLVLDHWACDRHDCVNVDHMRPVTTRENVLRSDTSHAARNLAKTHCPANHPYDEQNTRIRACDNGRVCLTCTRKYDREAKRAQRAQRAAARATSLA